LTELSEAVEGFHLVLGLLQFGGARESLGNGLSFYFSRKPEIRAMTGLIGLMAATVGLSAATANGRNRATAKVTQLQDLAKNRGPPLFESGEGIWHRAPPLLTYHYVRILATEKETHH
jgi:hypothetical protein